MQLSATWLECRLPRAPEPWCHAPAPSAQETPRTEPRPCAGSSRSATVRKVMGCPRVRQWSHAAGDVQCCCLLRTKWNSV
eukprot:scaffold3340_cov255-Pinguiococcus_pyrenoidosus.AAC.17